MKITEEIQAEIERIRESLPGGNLKERAVVEASKDPDSPLHPHFMWDDDAEAAMRHRDEIARRLIMRIVVTPHEAKELSVKVGIRKYHGRIDGKGYHHVSEVTTQKTIRDALLRQARGDLLSARRKYRDLEELGGVMSAIDEAFPEEVAAVS